MLGSKPFCLALVAAAISGAALQPAAAQPQGGDLTGMWTRGPVSQAQFRPPESGPGPVVNITQANPDAETRTANTYIGDHENPILRPWTAEALQRIANERRNGNPVNSAQQACRPHGVPFILSLNDAVQFLQTEDLLVILYAREMRPRLVYLNAEHPEGLTPSAYGHSVGHWEGDTLVVDTVGQTDETWTDRLGTPHSEEMRVVEHYQKTDDDLMRVDIMVEDPIAFTMPWRAWVEYAPDNEDEYFEQVCAENNINVVTGEEHDIPRDDTPDF